MNNNKDCRVGQFTDNHHHILCLQTVARKSPVCQFCLEGIFLANLIVALIIVQLIHTIQFQFQFVFYAGDDGNSDIHR